MQVIYFLLSFNQKLIKVKQKLLLVSRNNFMHL